MIKVQGRRLAWVQIGRRFGGGIILGLLMRLGNDRDGTRSYLVEIRVGKYKYG